jgi:hypothetical protein
MRRKKCLIGFCRRNNHMAMFNRTRIVIAFEADLDSTPGWGHQSEDWVALATERFAQQHYNTSSEVLSIEERPKIFVEGKGWINPIFSDHPDYVEEA